MTRKRMMPLSGIKRERAMNGFVEMIFFTSRQKVSSSGLAHKEGQPERFDAPR